MKALLIGAAFCVGLFTVGCAEKATERKLAGDVAQEAPVANTAQLQNEAENLINQSNLKVQQKEELKELQVSTSHKLMGFRDESLKLRSLLIKRVLSPKYDKAEVALIQKKMKKIEGERLALIFKTIDKANGILGRETQAEESERMVNQMMLYRDNH